MRHTIRVLFDKHRSAPIIRLSRNVFRMRNIMRQVFRNSLLLVVTLAALSLAPPIPAADEAPYDLVIRHGKLVDGTGNPWVYGDVAVRGHRIVAVGRVPAAPAKREINGRGLIVAPG